MVIIRKRENGNEYYLVPSRSRSRRYYEVWFSNSLKNPGWKCHCEFISLKPDEVCRHIKLVRYYSEFSPKMIVDDPDNYFS